MAEGLEAENYASEREETEKYLMEFWTRLEATLVYYRKKIEFLREDGLFAEICSGLETRYEETLSEARKLTEALEKTLQSENQHKSPALRERVLQDMEAILRPTARIDSSGSAWFFIHHFELVEGMVKWLSEFADRIGGVAENLWRRIDNIPRDTADWTSLESVRLSTIEFQKHMLSREIAYLREKRDLLERQTR